MLMVKLCSWEGQDFNRPLEQKLQPWSTYWAYITLVYPSVQRPQQSIEKPRASETFTACPLAGLWKRALLVKDMLVKYTPREQLIPMPWHWPQTQEILSVVLRWQDPELPSRAQMFPILPCTKLSMDMRSQSCVQLHRPQFPICCFLPWRGLGLV